jgi:hypothetical protein
MHYTDLENLRKMFHIRQLEYEMEKTDYTGNKYSLDKLKTMTIYEIGNMIKELTYEREI